MWQNIPMGIALDESLMRVLLAGGAAIEEWPGWMETVAQDDAAFGRAYVAPLLSVDDPEELGLDLNFTTFVHLPAKAVVPAGGHG